MSFTPRVLTIAFVCLTSACSEYGVSPENDKGGGPAPDIVVDPPSLEFELLSAGQEDKKKFTVRNVGSETLHVSDVVIGSGIAFQIEEDETEFELEPEEEREISVSFTPMGAAENFGQALVLSDDPDTPEAPVDLLGYGAVPELQITPDSYVFGDTPIPCGASVELEFKNVGTEELVITEFDYRSGGLLTFDDAALQSELQSSGGEIRLAPDETRTAWVTFTPTTVGSDTAELEVTCNDPRGVVQADQNGEGSYSDEASEAFTEPGVPPVDVIFLIDQSCSMEGDNTADVNNGIPPFVDELQQVADWQLIEVTHIDGCANGGIITPAMANPDSLLINNAWNHTFPSPGYDPVISESLLYMAALALDQTDPGECNEGFMRPGALLHVIVLSDEPERSGTPYSQWLDIYETYVPAAEYVKVSAIVDINTNCGEGPNGYLEAANATGGAVLNICNSNWGLSLSDIASEVLEGIRTYNLSDPAIPETIVVTVDGVETTDFTYSDAGNSVTINSPPIGEGDLVEISYGVAAECN